MLARPFILQAEMLARICPRIASLSENIRQKTSSRVDTRLVSVASESDRGSIPLLSYILMASINVHYREVVKVHVFEPRYRWMLRQALPPLSRH